MRYVDIPKGDTFAAVKLLSEFFDICEWYAGHILDEANEAYVKGLEPLGAMVRNPCKCALHDLIWDAYEQGLEDSTKHPIRLDRTVGGLCLDCGATSPYGQTECGMCEGARISKRVLVTSLRGDRPRMIDGEAWQGESIILHDRPSLESDLEGEGYLVL